MHNGQTLNLVDSGKQKANFILFEILYASSIYNANDSFYFEIVSLITLWAFSYRSVDVEYMFSLITN